MPRFERELEALRKELAEVASRTSSIDSGTASPSGAISPASDDDFSVGPSPRLRSEDSLPSVDSAVSLPRPKDE